MIKIDDNRHQLIGFSTEEERAGFLRDLTDKHPFFQGRSGESFDVVTLAKDELTFDWSTRQLYPNLEHLSATDIRMRYLVAIRIGEGTAP